MNSVIEAYNEHRDRQNEDGNIPDHGHPYGGMGVTFWSEVPSGVREDGAAMVPGGIFFTTDNLDGGGDTCVNGTSWMQAGALYGLSRGEDGFASWRPMIFDVTPAQLREMASMCEMIARAIEEG